MAKKIESQDLQNLTRKPRLGMRPPIIMKDTPEDRKPLDEYMRYLETQGTLGNAQEESERLSGYFSDLSNALQKVTASIRGRKRKKEVKKLSSREGLHRVFNGMAKHCKSTMLSDIVIMPFNLEKESSRDSLGPESAATYFHHYIFSFGFMTAYEGGNREPAQGSTSFAVFNIDSRALDALAPYAPEKMLRDLQTLMTLVNHDMLHHLTLPLVNPEITQNLAKSAAKIEEWDRSITTKIGSPDYYEDWAQIGQEVVLNGPGTEPLQQEIKKILSGYISELVRICGEMKKQDISPDEIHKTSSFFSILAGHALCRAFPLNHPLMTFWAKAALGADPHPERNPEDVAEKIAFATGRILPAQGTGYEHVRAVGLGIQGMRDLVMSYRQSGLDLLPDDPARMDLKTLKLFELAALSIDDTRPHTPQPKNAPDRALREIAGRSLIDMVVAAAKTTGITR